MLRPAFPAMVSAALAVNACVATDPVEPDGNSSYSIDRGGRNGAVESDGSYQLVERLEDVPRAFSNVREFSRLVGIGKTRETLVVGLDGQLRVYRDEEFREVLATYGGKPRSILHYQKTDSDSPDWLDNYKKMSILGSTGHKLRVSVDGEEGWIARNSVKFNHAPFIVTKDGHYVADVFTDQLYYEGNRVYSWFIEENGKPVLVVRLANPERSSWDVLYLKYKFDPSRKKFTDVRVSKTPIAIGKNTPIQGMLDEEDWKNFAAETGYRKPGPAQSDGGLPLNPDTPAVRIGKYIYVNF